MHASPVRLASKYLLLWARYCLRNFPAGRYMIILGSDSKGKLSQSEIDEKCGPCGVCPYMYLRIFKTSADDNPAEEVRVHSFKRQTRNTPKECVHSKKCDMLNYVTFSDASAFAIESHQMLKNKTKSTSDGRFVGVALNIDIPGIDEAEKHRLEQTVETALDNPDYGFLVESGISN